MAKTGRKSTYSKDYPKMARILKKLGYTDKQVAKELGVSEVTFIAWKKKYPELLKAVKAGKREQTAKVIGKLFERSLGYDYYEEKAMIVGKEIRVVEIRRHMPPNVTAQIFWLKCKDPDNWTENNLVTLDGDFKDLLEGFFSKQNKKLDE